jgi:hypothetical protein
MKGDKWAPDRLGESLGCLAGWVTGAEFGSVVPIIGAARGAFWGCVVGGIAGHANGM